MSPYKSEFAQKWSATPVHEGIHGRCHANQNCDDNQAKGNVFHRYLLSVPLVNHMTTPPSSQARIVGMAKHTKKTGPA